MALNSRGRKRSTLVQVPLLAVVFITLVAVVVAACGSSTSSSSITTETTSAPLSTVITQGSGANQFGPGPTFTIHNGVLTPTELSVPRGSAVTWVDADDDTTKTYQFVADDGSFDTGTLGEGGSYSFTFEKAGTFPFHEKNDPSIKGSVTVQ